LRALSVVPGAFTADAARRLLDARADAAAILEDLVDQSLLQVADTPTGARFRMLETVRELSAARREAAGETDRAVGAFLAWARDFGVAHHQAPFGADPFPSVERIRAEQDNLAQALRQGLARADGGTVAAAAAVLGALSTVKSNSPRVAALAAAAAPALSRFRPAPELVEVTRTALVLCTAFTFLVKGPRAVRSLVALRRLPAAPPDTLPRAVAIVLGAVAADRAALLDLCDSGEPLLAGTANSVASYLCESQGDLDGARKAAERTLEAFAQRSVPWLWALTHCRIAELGMLVEQGAEAQRHLRAALPVLERLGARSDVIGIRWWMVLTSLQLGAVDEAERWLEQAAPQPGDEPVGALTYGLGVRAEILLARGEVEAGLRLWRRVVDLLRNAQEPIFGIDVAADQEPWLLEAEAVAVVAHARHGRLDLVEAVAGELPQRLETVLTSPEAPSPYLLAEFPVCGALLLALAAVDLDRGARSGDRRAARSGARLTALAERLRFLRNFQPTMASARARRAAEAADRSAYGDAASSYAGLGGGELRAAALAELRARAAP
jgi:hypothetical protein